MAHPLAPQNSAASVRRRPQPIDARVAASSGLGYSLPSRIRRRRQPTSKICAHTSVSLVAAAWHDRDPHLPLSIESDAQPDLRAAGTALFD